MSPQVNAPVRFRYPDVQVGREYKGLRVVALVADARPRKWWCRCVHCGHERAVVQYTIVGSGGRRCPNGSCRLGFAIVGSRAENEAHPIEFATWKNMLWRCHLAPPLKVVSSRSFPHPQFVNYRGRGVVVCERWRVFADFLADMGPRPGAGLSIDRVDVDGNYGPGNCRWATATEQSNNRRSTRRYKRRCAAEAAFGGVPV